MILSLITVVYNDVRVARALDSVLVQRLDAGDSMEVVVVDDSDDETSELLRRYGDAIAVIRPPARRGMYAARNIGIQCTSGEIIGFLNADDYYVDDLVLRDVLRAFRSPDRPLMVHGRTTIVSADGTPLRTTKQMNTTTRRAVRGYMGEDPSTFWHRTVFEQHGLYRENYLIVGDYEFGLRAVFRGGVRRRALAIPRSLTCMETGGMSSRNGVLQLKERVRARRDSGYHLFGIPITVEFLLDMAIPKIRRSTRRAIWRVAWTRFPPIPGWMSWRRRGRA